MLLSVAPQPHNVTANGPLSPPPKQILLSLTNSPSLHNGFNSTWVCETELKTVSATSLIPAHIFPTSVDGGSITGDTLPSERFLQHCAVSSCRQLPPPHFALLQASENGLPGGVFSLVKKVVPPSHLGISDGAVEPEDLYGSHLMKTGFSSFLPANAHFHA